MGLARLLLRLALGRRLPLTTGTLRVSGPGARITIRRDRFGVPVIEAGGETDVAFGLGFCQGQDRAFQLECLLRVGRGTLAELAGPAAVPLDRLSRRIGLLLAAERQLGLLLPEHRELLAAFASGVGEGVSRGLPSRPHELVLLRGRPTAWTATDCLGAMYLVAFLQASNWGPELARLKVLTTDGAAALDALDPENRAPDPLGSRCAALDRLAADLKAFTAVAAASAGSNAWALAPSRTATDRPLLANDPHLPPSLPPHWYLAHLSGPAVSCAGACWVGSPLVIAGHNGFAAWGVTSGLVDTTDLFLEEVGPDGRSVRQGGGFVACEVREEEIGVRGAEPIAEEVLVTPRGPIIGPALTGEVGAVSMLGTWLDAQPMSGIFRLHAVRSVEDFRSALADWAALSWHMVYADETGTIARQLVARVPRRLKGTGSIPLPGWDPEVGWAPERVSYNDLPRAVDPVEGYVAAANEEPALANGGPFLGLDFSDGYRRDRIGEALAGRDDWDVAATQALQLDERSLPWRDLREAILAVESDDPDAVRGLELLRAWDGRVSAGAPAAAVFELLVAELATRVARARAPGSWRWVLGLGFTPVAPTTLFAMRRVRHLASVLALRQPGLLPRPWADELADALTATVRRLRAARGEAPNAWAWGKVRPLTLRHPLSSKKPLRAVFDLGPIPFGGDSHTVSAGSVSPLDPTGNPCLIASLRAVVDVGAWDASRFALPGGQSGNPLSPHYADQLSFWRSGEGVPIPWSADAVAAATRSTLILEPPDRKR